jgi:hypothetical protein
MTPACASARAPTPTGGRAAFRGLRGEDLYDRPGELMEKERPDALFVGIPHHSYPVVMRARARPQRALREPCRHHGDGAGDGRYRARKKPQTGRQLPVPATTATPTRSCSAARACSAKSRMPGEHALRRGPEYFAAGACDQGSRAGGRHAPHAGEPLDDIALEAMGTRLRRDGMTARRRFAVVEVRTSALEQ